MSSDLDPVLAYGVVMPPQRDGAPCLPTIYGVSQLYADEGNFAWYAVCWSNYAPCVGVSQGGELSVHSMFVWSGQLFATIDEAVQFVEVRSQ